MLIHRMAYCGWVLGLGFAGYLLGGGVVQGRGVDIPRGEGGDGAFYFGGWREGLADGLEGLCGTLLLRQAYAARLDTGFVPLHMGTAADVGRLCGGTVAGVPREGRPRG